jgi:rhamnogalacturonyl hydrolase YesR
MNSNKKLILIAVSFVGLMDAGARAATAPPALDREQVLQDADAIAEVQLKKLPEPFRPTWIYGVMEAGYADFSHASPHGQSYSAALTDWAEKAKWSLLAQKSSETNADDLCIGQTYLDLYVAHPSPARIDPLKKRLDLFVEHINAEPATATKITWFWCDALFMAPPVLARMSAVTGDQKYIDAMDTEYWRTVAALYDKEVHLFFRDGRFPEKKDARGKKIFWSRGNGWVLAGLARVLEYMPADYPTRPKYVALFKEMAAAIAPLQSSDGTWHSSLFDPTLFNGPETSGTSLFTYALAWGINNNLLDRKTYLPIIISAWRAMIADRRPDGLPGYVQSVAYQPNKTKPTGTQLYTTGTMLMDAVEIAKLPRD